MLPQQKTPAEVSPSLPQHQITSDNNHGEPDKKPFSIRDYVFACRQKDIASNWPFPEKYLQFCFKHGITDALPPLQSHISAIQSIRGAVDLNCTQQDNNNVDYLEDKEPDAIEQEIEDLGKSDSDSEEPISQLSIQHCDLSPPNSSCKDEANETEDSPHVASSIVVSTDQPSTRVTSSEFNVVHCYETWTSSRNRRHMKKRGKGKHNKRSMVNILDVAKPCTAEDLLRVKRLCCVSSIPLDVEGEGIDQINVKHDSKSDLTKDYSSEQLERDDTDESNLSRKTLVVKLMFNSRKSNVGDKV